MYENLKSIIHEEIPTLIEFINSNCEPCAMIEPTLQQVKNSIGKRLNIFIINVQDVPSIVQEYDINSVPMLVLFRGDEIIWKTTNVLSKQEIIDKVLHSI